MPAPAKRAVADFLRTAKVVDTMMAPMGPRKGLLVMLAAEARVLRLEIDGLFAHLRETDRTDLVCFRCSADPGAPNPDRTVARVRRGMAALLRNRGFATRRGRPAALSALVARAGAATMAFPEGLCVVAGTPLFEATCGTLASPTFSQRAIDAFAPLLRWYAPTGWRTTHDGTGRLISDRQRLPAERDMSGHARLAVAGDLHAILGDADLWRGTRWERPEDWAREIGADDLLGA